MHRLTGAPRHLAALAHRATAVLATMAPSHRATALTSRLAALAPTFIVGVLFLIGIGACGFSDADSTRRGTVVIDTLESGTILVRNSPPAERYASPRWVLEEELRIGTLEGEGPDLFGEIKGIEVDEEVRIYVLESQAQEIRVFGADGSHLFTFGRKGEGPGEFTGAHGLARAPDGRIWVPDHRTNRYSVFEPDGRFVTSYRTQFWRYGYIWCCGFGRDGMLYDEAGRNPDDQEDRRRYLRRFDDSLELLASLPEPAAAPGYEPNTYTFPDPSGAFDRGVMRVPFGAGRSVAFDSRGGFLTMMTDRYRIEQLDFVGDTLRIIEAELEPVRVSAAEREAAIARVREFAEQVGGGSVDFSRIPATKPLLVSSLVDDADRLWVRTATAVEGTTFDIFDAEGRFLGAVRADFEIPGYWRPTIRGDYLYTLVEGELDEPYVVRARLALSEGG